jgi:hypothetical protein
MMANARFLTAAVLVAAACYGLGYLKGEVDQDRERNRDLQSQVDARLPLPAATPEFRAPEPTPAALDTPAPRGIGSPFETP